MLEELAQRGTVAAIDAIDEIVTLVDSSLDVTRIGLAHVLNGRPESSWRRRVRVLPPPQRIGVKAP